MLTNTIAINVPDTLSCSHSIHLSATDAICCSHAIRLSEAIRLSGLLSDAQIGSIPGALHVTAVAICVAFIFNGRKMADAEGVEGLASEAKIITRLYNVRSSASTFVCVPLLILSYFNK
jgi:hypothetical protein